MRSLWIVLALLGLAAAASVVWLLATIGFREPAPGQTAGINTEDGANPVELQVVEPQPTKPRNDEEAQVKGERRGTADGVAAPRRAMSGDAALVVLALAEENNNPIVGVRVFVWPLPPPPDFEIRWGSSSAARLGTSPVTDDEGRAQIAVPTGVRLGIQASDDRNLWGFVELQIEPLEQHETREIELTLTSQADIHFVARVVDDAGGFVLPGAWASVAGLKTVIEEATGHLWDPKDPPPLGERRPRGAESVRIETDAAGWFELDSSSEAHEFARVQAPGYGWALVPIEKGHETRATAREVRLMRPAVVEAVVLAPGRSPVEDARVLLSTSSSLLNPHQRQIEFVLLSETVIWSELTGPDGRVRIKELPAGVPLDVELKPLGESVQRQLGSLTLLPGETRRLEFLVGMGAVVAGWVRRPDGIPAIDSDIWMKPGSKQWGLVFGPFEESEVRRSRTDEGGRFRFDNVPDGVWLVGTAPDGPHAPVTDSVVVQGGVADHEVLLTAWGDLFIRGIVVDPNGRPSLATVFGYCAEAGVNSNERTDHLGRFSLGPLVPGSYLVTASDTRSGENELVDSAPVIVDAGASDVVLMLREGASIAGRVVDAATGAGVEGTVVLSRAGLEGEWGGIVLSGSGPGGDFAFTGIEPGTYDVCASTPGGTCGFLSGVQALAGEAVRSLRVAVGPGARLSVQYGDEQEYGQILVRKDEVLVAIAVVQRGKSETWVVPAGELEVVCLDRKGEGPESRRQRNQHVDLAVGELGEVRFGPEQDQR